MSGRPKRSLCEVKMKPGLYRRLKGFQGYGMSANGSFTQRVGRAEKERAVAAARREWRSHLTLDTDMEL